MRKALVECKILSSIARKSGGVVWTVWWLGAVTREEVQGGIPAYDSAPPRPRTTPAQQRAGNRENMITMAVLESLASPRSPSGGPLNNVTSMPHCHRVTGGICIVVLGCSE